MEVLHVSMTVLWSFSIFAIHLLCMEPLITAAKLNGNQTDRVALLGFKDGVTQDPFGSLSSWNDSLDFCMWRGVACSHRHRRVTVLNLEGQRLVGSISPSIGNLTFLRKIILQNNSFYGEIPQEIGRLFRLRDIFLENNLFTGEIPSNLSHCSNLISLGLGFNNLVGEIPMELRSLLKLKGFSIHFNNITGRIPSFLGNFSSLVILSLASNKLNGNIPDSISRLKNLIFLGLTGNGLSGVIPPSLFNLSALQVFTVVDNQLHGSLPTNIGLAFPNLQSFRIGGNKFSGVIPVSMINASKLEILDISNNFLIGDVPVNPAGLQALQWLTIAGNQLGRWETGDLTFLTSLMNCSRLEQVDVSENHFGGEFPNSIATDFPTKLTNFWLRGNQISGSIPTWFENLVSLSELDIRENLLTGKIPDAIGKLQKLQILYLDQNRLSGQIPSFLGNLTVLSQLSLSQNDFTGSIPSSLGTCKNLLSLDLSQNKLDGTIPKQVISLPSILSLFLYHNSLNGSLPIEVGNMKNIVEFYLFGNKLSGEIPKTIGDCWTLERLLLADNFFQGNIPQSLSSLRGLQILDLSENNLSGPIPSYLENFTLQNLNLSFNHFEGELPTKGVFGNQSVISIVGNNKLCGGIPQLQLPPCSNQVSKKHKGKSIAFIVTITIAGVALCTSVATIFLIVYLRRKWRKKSSSTSILGDKYLRVSYDVLLKATGGFASDNLIGVGSFGSLYKGILQQYEKPVAVKVLNLQQEGASKSFMAECKALTKIRHRNLLKIITCCSSVDFKGNDFKALVLEFMPKGSLENWLHPHFTGQRDQPRYLNLLQRLNIAIDIASALDYLHHHCQTPIIHCDLKPSNVLLDDDMIAHVGDFGLAKILSKANSNSDEEQTSLAMLHGSIGYIAPEYGTSVEVSTQGDVYSYGILLLEMFTGKRPTDEMFKNGLSLHYCSKIALPERVMEIVDSSMLLEEELEEDINNEESWREKKSKMQVCLASIVGIGVACSVETPSDRMDIDKVIKELLMIKDMLLEVGIHGER